MLDAPAPALDGGAHLHRVRALAHQRTVGSQGDPDVLIGQDVVSRESTLYPVRNLGTPGVGVALPEIQQVLFDEREHFFGRSQQRFELFDPGSHLAVLVLQLTPLQGSQATQLHIQDRLSLDIGKLELIDEILLGRIGTARAPDQGDDLIQHVERTQQPFQDMCPFAGTLQLVPAAPHDDILPVLEVMRAGCA